MIGNYQGKSHLLYYVCSAKYELQTSTKCLKPIQHYMQSSEKLNDIMRKLKRTLNTLIFFIMKKSRESKE